MSGNRLWQPNGVNVEVLQKVQINENKFNATRKTQFLIVPLHELFPQQTNFKISDIRSTGKIEISHV
jgi:hypothetical protein